MKKLLLIIDDYNELLFLEGILKKMGFDVVGIQNTPKAEREILGFFPDVMIITGKSKTIDAVAFCQKIQNLYKKNVTPPKFILMVSGAGAGDQHSNLFHGYVDSPVDPVSLIEKISEVCQLETEALLSKLESFTKKQENAKKESKEYTEHSQKESSTASGAKEHKFSMADPSPEKRSQNYKEILQHLDPIEKKSLPRDKMEEHVKKLKRDSAHQYNEPDHDSQNDLLLQLLFKKK